MGRAPRINVGNLVYHIVNRANSRRTLFTEDEAYTHFEFLLKDAVERFDMRLLAYALMPNHWHLILYPRADGDMSLFMQWLTLTHTQQYHVWKETVGYGQIYQGRYKSFLIDTDQYLLTAIKYVERNPVRAKLARRVEDWRWSSGHRRLQGAKKAQALISNSPVELPTNYRAWINTPESAAELEAIRLSNVKGIPFGNPAWVEETVEKYGLQATMRSGGRPRRELK